MALYFVVHDSRTPCLRVIINTGLVCDVVVHPMDTVRTRLMMQVRLRARLPSNSEEHATPRVQTSTSATQYRGVADAFVSIVRNEGIRTLYRGAGVGT